MVAIAAALALAAHYFAFEHDRFARDTERGAAPIRIVSLPGATELALPEIAIEPAAAAPLPSPVLRPSSLLALAALEYSTQPHRFQHVIRVDGGDSLFQALMKSGVTGADAQRAAAALSGSDTDRSVRQGQLVTLDFGIVEGAQNRFLGLRFDATYDRTVAIERRAEDDFAARHIRKEITTELVRSNGLIEHGLFHAGLHAGLPPEPLVRLIHLFAYEVDFQRDLNRGDGFEVLLERHRDRHGRVVRYGEIYYAALMLSGRPIRLYRWQDGDGTAEYFNERGESTKKTLMRTPVDGARLSSGFGLRRHPILGFSKLHRGIDFAVPSGTPIFAAGNGTIEKLGWQPGYGNALVLRHNNELSTLYAHMMTFAVAMAPGRRVRQGEVIGYVGSTGLSTGPHLHYEVHQFGQAIDPFHLKLPARQHLVGPELKRFLDRSRAADAAFRGLAKNAERMPSVTAAADRNVPTCGIQLSDTLADQQGC